MLLHWCIGEGSWEEFQPVHPKGNQSWIFIRRTDADAEVPILWPLIRRTDSLEKTLMLGKIKDRRRRRWQRIRWLDGITDSMDMSLSNFGSWWWTGKAGMWQSMRSQRVGCHWTTELTDWYLQASQVVLVVRNPPANVGEVGSIFGSRRSLAGRHDNPLQYSCLENPMDRAAWQATVHRVTQNQTRLKPLST